MSTSAQVRSEWSSVIFADASITAITSNIYNYSILYDSETEKDKIFSGQEINFITYEVKRGTTKKLSSCVEYDYNVQVNYFKERNQDGSNELAVIDFFDTLNSLILSTASFKETWNSTVDFFSFESQSPDMELIEIDNKPVFKGSFEYLGIKTAQI